MHSDQVLGGERQELSLNAKSNRLLVLCKLLRLGNDKQLKASSKSGYARVLG